MVNTKLTIGRFEYFFSSPLHMKEAVADMEIHGGSHHPSEPMSKPTQLASFVYDREAGEFIKQRAELIDVLRSL